MKKLQILAAVSAGCMFPGMLSAVQAGASEKYGIDSAVFDVTLTEDGSAKICEVWTLHYDDGVYYDFRRDILTGTTTAERVSDMKLLGFAVNGKDETEAVRMERQETGADWSLYWHTWKDDNADETVYHVAVSYMLYDAVKLWRDNYVFSYQFVTPSVPVPVDKVTVMLKQEHGDMPCENRVLTADAVCRDCGMPKTDCMQFTGSVTEGKYQVTAIYDKNASFYGISAVIPDTEQPKTEEPAVQKETDVTEQAAAEQQNVQSVRKNAEEKANKETYKAIADFTVLFTGVFGAAVAAVLLFLVYQFYDKASSFLAKKLLCLMDALQDKH